MFIDTKIKILKFVDHWIGEPICVLLSLVHRITHPVYHTFLNIPVRKYPKSILIIKFFGLGSIILASPLLKSIKNKYPDSRIIFLTFGDNSDLVKRLCLGEEVKTVNTRNPFTLLCSIFSNLVYFSFNKPNISIDLEFYSKFSTIMLYLSGAKWRVGFYTARFWRNSLVNVPVYFNYARHILEIYSMVATSIGADVKDLVPSLIPVDAEERNFINRLFLKKKIKSDDFLLGVNINASNLAYCRRWHKERFAQVINELLKKYKELRVFLTGNSSEKEYTSSIFKLLEEDIKGRVLDVSGLLNFGQFIALLNRLSFLLTNDSGPFHLARAQGIFTISIWGPGSPDLYGPYKEGKDKHRIIYKRWPCSPCLYMYRTDAGYFCKKMYLCLNDIRSQEVVRLVEDAIDRFDRREEKKA